MSYSGLVISGALLTNCNVEIMILGYLLQFQSGIALSSLGLDFKCVLLKNYNVKSLIALYLLKYHIVWPNC